MKTIMREYIEIMNRNLEEKNKQIKTLTDLLSKYTSTMERSFESRRASRQCTKKLPTKRPAVTVPSFIKVIPGGKKPKYPHMPKPSFVNTIESPETAT
jgi:hypothetical protein